MCLFQGFYVSCFNYYTFEPPHAKTWTHILKNIKKWFFTDYDRLQFKFTEQEIWDKYQAYLLMIYEGNGDGDDNDVKN